MPNKKERTDNEYRKAWIKMLKTAPSRGGQEPQKSG